MSMCLLMLHMLAASECVHSMLASTVLECSDCVLVWKCRLPYLESSQAGVALLETVKRANLQVSVACCSRPVHNLSRLSYNCHRALINVSDMHLQDLGQRLTAGLAKWTKPTLLLTGDGDKYIKVRALTLSISCSAPSCVSGANSERFLTACLADPQPAEAQAVAESNPSNISAKVIEAAGHQPQVQTVKFWWQLSCMYQYMVEHYC
jgi:pimeloyl-ACP methyl ester carboxylesterase